MKVIKPLILTDAMLTSSSVAEPAAGESVYSAATTYALGATAILTSTHRVYQSLQASNLGRAPDTNPLWWLDIGPTARWAMFDGQVSTATVAASPLAVSIAPGNINSLALLAMVGTSVTITMLDAPGGASVYSRTESLDSSIVVDWWQYFFEPITQRGDLVLTDLPSYSAGVVSAAITGGGNVACGGLVLGAVYDMGDTQMGAKITYVDYSRKDTNEFGVTTFVKRPFSKRLSANVRISTQLFAKVEQLVGALRATPCVWIGDETAIFAPLIIYGFYREFGIAVDYPTYLLCNHEIEGLI